MFRSDTILEVSGALIAHGLFMLSWYILIVIQTGLIAKKNYKLHMLLGQGSMAIVIGIIISGILITIISYRTTEDIGPVGMNLFIVVDLLILYSLALAKRKNGASHKRFMTYASLAMLVPALARVTFVLKLDPFFSLPMLLILLIVPLVYDYRTLKKVHRASLIGSIVVLVGTIISIVLVSTPAFATLADRLLI